MYFVVSKYLTNCRPKQFEIATLAVYLLGGAEKAVDTEDVAIKCYELAPVLFSWQKHKDQINLELVRVSLSDAKKKKSGELLTGLGREGWRLTSAGLDWINRKGKALLGTAAAEMKLRTSKSGSIDTVRRQRERARLTASSAWTQWADHRSMSEKDAREVFRIDEYTTDKMLDVKVARLRVLFEDDADICAFLDHASSLAMKK